MRCAPTIRVKITNPGFPHEHALHSRHSLLIGILILAIANICFSAKAVIIKLMYRYEVSTQSVIALRMLFSLPVYMAVAWYLHRRTNNVRLTGREWLAISADDLGHWQDSVCEAGALEPA